jgi:hypothetical protein
MVRLERALETHVRRAISEAQRGTSLHKLGLALSLLDLLGSNRLGSDNNSTLGQVDAGARDVLGMRAAPLRRMADELLVSQEVRDAFERARDEAKREVFGPDWQGVVRGYAEYVGTCSTG